MAYWSRRAVQCFAHKASDDNCAGDQPLRLIPRIRAGQWEWEVYFRDGPRSKILCLDTRGLGLLVRIHFGQEFHHGLVEGFRLIQIREVACIGDDH